jgi:hypothetical protein
LYTKVCFIVRWAIISYRTRHMSLP